MNSLFNYTALFEKPALFALGHDAMWQHLTGPLVGLVLTSKTPAVGFVARSAGLALQTALLASLAPLRGAPRFGDVCEGVELGFQSIERGP